MKLIYVSGPYSAGYGRSIADNIAVARTAAIRIWDSGNAALCPHLNTAHFEEDCRAEWIDYITGDLIMVERCDAVVMLPNWRQSRGAVQEHDHAVSHGKPVYEWPELPR